MEIIYFTSLPQVTQLIVAQVESSCGEPSAGEIPIIIGLVAVLGIAFVAAGIGLAEIATTLVGLIMAGASVDAIGAALGAHLTVAGSCLEALGTLVGAILFALGCSS